MGELFALLKNIGDVRDCEAYILISHFCSCLFNQNCRYSVHPCFVSVCLFIFHSTGRQNDCFLTVMRWYGCLCLFIMSSQDERIRLHCILQNQAVALYLSHLGMKLTRNWMKAGFAIISSVCKYQLRRLRYYTFYEVNLQCYEQRINRA